MAARLEPVAAFTPPQVGAEALVRLLDPIREACRRRFFAASDERTVTIADLVELGLIDDTQARSLYARN